MYVRIIFLQAVYYIYFMLCISYQIKFYFDQIDFHLYQIYLQLKNETYALLEKNSHHFLCIILEIKTIDASAIKIYY